MVVNKWNKIMLRLAPEPVFINCVKKGDGVNSLHFSFFIWKKKWTKDYYLIQLLSATSKKMHAKWLKYMSHNAMLNVSSYVKMEDWRIHWIKLQRTIYTTLRRLIVAGVRGSWGIQESFRFFMQTSQKIIQGH